MTWYWTVACISKGRSHTLIKTKKTLANIVECTPEVVEGFLDFIPKGLSGDGFALCGVSLSDFERTVENAAQLFIQVVYVPRFKLKLDAAVLVTVAEVGSTFEIVPANF